MLATSEPARGISNKADNPRTDIDLARARLGDSIQKTLGLTSELKDRLEYVLLPPQPMNASEAKPVPVARTPLANDLHEMAAQLNAANERLFDLLDRLGL